MEEVTTEFEKQQRLIEMNVWHTNKSTFISS